MEHISGFAGGFHGEIQGSKVRPFDLFIADIERNAIVQRGKPFFRAQKRERRTAAVKDIVFPGAGRAAVDRAGTQPHERQSTVANKLRLLKLPDYIKNALSRGTISERHARALLKVPKERLEEVFMTITNRDYTVAKTEEYIKSLLDKNTRSKGVSNNVQIGVNTIRQAYDMCRKSGIDADFQLTEYSDNMKITIKIKK